MTDKDLNELTDVELDQMLEEVADTRPASDITEQPKPWRRAMNMLLWGIGLSTVTLNFWNLNIFLPAIGSILTLLGFRALRHENSGFRYAYAASWLKLIWCLIILFFNSTVYTAITNVSVFLNVGAYFSALVGFLMLLFLRSGIRTVQKKAGLDPHGGTGMVIWYLIMILLALVNFTGIAVWGLLISYIFLLRGLYKLSGELDEAGYAISPAPVRLSNRAAGILYACVILILTLSGYCFFNRYPMDWTEQETVQSEAVEKVREELISLGFPEYVLNDLTEEEILSCDGAVCVLVETRDYDMDQGRGIGTPEEIASGKHALLTEDQAQRQLRTTYIGVQFPDERERWMIVQHFQWLTDTAFYGTESIQMYPSYYHGGWGRGSYFSGRVLYDLDGATYTSDYFSLGNVTYQSDNLLFPGTGQSDTTAVFAAFSMPSKGENQRGYVIYDTLETEDGWILESVFHYTHQHSFLQYPVQTAMEFDMTYWGNNGTAFRTIQTSLLIATHLDEPELLN